MRRLLSIALIGTAAMTASAAFDMTSWLVKRRQQTEEAFRLRDAYTNCVARLETPAENVSISLETHPDGSMKTQIFARRAQFFLDAGMIWAEGVELRKFKADGVQELQIDAENCAIDREARAGWADGATKIVHGTTVMSGRRVYFSSAKSYIKIFRDTDLVDTNLKMGGFRP